MARWRMRVSFSGLTLAVALGVATACGGQSETPSGDSNAEAGDAGNGGNTTSGGTGGVAGTIDTGGTVAVGGTGGTDGGTGGSVPIGGTGGSGGGRPCLYGGQTYEDGTSFPAADGCNTCTCRDGGIGCTLIGCPPPGECDELTAAYQREFEAAKTCYPDLDRQCERLVASALECGCPEFVNEPAAINLLGQIGLAYNDRGCRTGVTCGMCPPDPTSAYCSSDGRCVDSVGE